MENDRQQRVDKFIRAIHWENMELADELGLDLTTDEMHRIKDSLVLLWVQDKLPVPYVQRICQYVEGP